MKSLSKSKFVTGLRCPKYLWMDLYAKDKAQVSTGKELSWSYGDMVEQLGRSLFPEGVLVDYKPWEILEAHEKALELINQNQKVIFEACALVKDTWMHARIDCLEYAGDDHWDLNEIKSATSVKEYHLRDLAYQTHVFREAGFNINRSILIHVNPEYIRHGELEPEKLLIKEDVSHLMDDLIENEIIPNIEDIRKIMEAKECPSVDIGSHCTQGWECPYYDYCHRHIPEYSIHDLFSGKKLDSLLDLGVVKIEDVPEDFPLTHKQEIVIKTHRTSTVHTEPEPLKEWINTLEYPLYMFDFETINPLIPLWDNCRVRETICFQWACYRIDKPGAKPVFTEFLSESQDDPREELIKAMLNCLGEKGTILAWFMSFEVSRIEELAQAFPKYKKDLLALIPRFDDLIDPFQALWVHHKDQHGSNSLKAVYPALIGDAYDQLEINNGGDASDTYLQFLLNEKGPEVLRPLRDYCHLDVLSMIQILDELKKLSSTR